jgi:hypothetical protein
MGQPSRSLEVITTTVVAAGEPEAVRVTPSGYMTAVRALLPILAAMLPQDRRAPCGLDDCRRNGARRRCWGGAGGGGDIPGGISDGGRHNTFKARRALSNLPRLWLTVGLTTTQGRLKPVSRRGSARSH